MIQKNTSTLVQIVLKVSKGAYIEWIEKVPIICLGSRESFDTNQQKLWTQVDFKFGLVSSKFGLGSILKSIIQSSSPSLVEPQYSMLRINPEEILGFHNGTVKLI